MKHTWLNFLGLTLLLLLFWIAVSGSLHWQQLLLGSAAALFVAWFNRNLLITPEERPPVTVKTLFWLTGYCAGLLADIVKANFHVAWLVLHPRMPISPQFMLLEVDLKRSGSRVLLANSITLTPGTLTVLADGGRFLVHALTRESGAGLERWALPEKLKRMEVEPR